MFHTLSAKITFGPQKYKAMFNLKNDTFLLQQLPFWWPILDADIHTHTHLCV